MTTTKKRTRKRKTPTLSAPRRRKHTIHKTPRRRRSLSAGGLNAAGIKGAIGLGIKGGIGGAVHEAPRFFMKKKPSNTMQAIWDIGGTIVMATFLKQREGAAGFAGAAVSRRMDQMFGKHMLHDGMEGHEWVDPNTLSDSGFDDEFGDAVAMDDDGNLYALAEGGEYEHIGHMDDFDDGMDDGMEDFDDFDDFDEGVNMNSASMLPLQGNAYSLANSAYNLY